MKHTSDSYCYLWINGFTGSADSVSHALGLSCKLHREAGHIFRSGKIAGINSWHSTPLTRDETPLDLKLRNLLVVLEAHQAQLLKISKGGEAGINCVGYYYDTHPAFHLDKTLLQQVVKLGLSLDFDLYNYCEPDAV